MKRKIWPAILLILLLTALWCFAPAEETQLNGIQSGDWVYLRNGDAAVVICYTGSETEISIPEELDGLPVVALGEKYGWQGIFTDKNRESIQAVHIPDSVLVINRSVFSRCTALEEVNIPAHIATIPDDCFARTGLKTIDLPEGLREIGNSAFERTPLAEIRLPASLKWIGRDAFASCTELKEITWPGSEIYIGKRAFRKTGIPEEKFTLPEQYAEAGYTNRYAFYSPADTTRRVDLSDKVTLDYVCKPDGTAGILEVFVSGGAPDKLVIPGEIEGLPVTGFYGDLNDNQESLKSLVLPDTMKEIGDMALQQLDVSSIQLPSQLVRIGQEALIYCRNLKEIKLPDSLRFIAYSSLLWSGQESESFQEDVNRQLYAIGIDRPYQTMLGSIGHYYDYDVNLDGMICEVQQDDENGRLQLLLWEIDPLCSLRESPDSWQGIPFATVPRDSIVIRGGVAYRLREDGASVEPVQVTDADGWDWTYPETVDGLPVQQGEYTWVKVMTDGLVCEVKTYDAKQGIEILQADEGKWDGTIPESIGVYPVLWLTKDIRIREDGFIFCGIPYKEKSLAVCGCERTDEAITVPDSVQGWKVTQIEKDAFRDMENLKSITLPASVDEIHEGAFTDCASLTDINVKNADAAIYKGAFVGIGEKWPEINGSCYSASTPQEDGNYALFADGTAEILHWPAEKNKLVIPAEIDGHPVISIGEDAFRDKEITSVDLPDSLVRIGKGAFYACKKLTSVTFPSGLEYLGDRAFYYCEKLSKLELVPSLKYVGQYAFYSTGVTAVTVPEGMESVPEGAFNFCTSLKTVTLPEGLKEIGDEAFLNCTGLTSVTLPESLERIGASAFKATKLKKVTVPAGVQFIGDDCFANYLPDTSWGTYYYAGPSVVFEGDPQVSNRIFGVLDDDEEYSYTEFWDRVELFIGHKIVKLDITTAPGTMVDRVFLSPLVVEKHYPAEKDMTAGETPVKETLEAADIPRDVQVLTVPEGVERIAPEAFKGIHTLYRVILPDSLKEIGDSAFEDCGGLQYVTLGAGLEKLGRRAFAECRNLKEIVLPEGITVIPESCFERDINLIRAVLPAGLIAIEEKAFYACCYLAEADLSRCASLETVGKQAFYINALKKIVLPDSVRTLGDAAFFCSTCMTDLKLSAGLEEIPDYAFYHCSHLKALEIPAGVRSIGEKAFYQARDMKTLTLNEGLEAIGAGAFRTFTDNVLVYNAHGRRYSSLQKISLPASVSKLGNGAFAGCDAVTSVSFVEGSALTEIPENCFLLCTFLKDVKIPDGIVSIGKNAFQACMTLKKIELPASLQTIGAGILADVPSGFTVIAPAGSEAERYIQTQYPDAKLKN